MKEGEEAESAALSLLQKQRLALLGKNYRCKMGEIDLVMKDGDTIVFVEVRKRSNPGFGGAAASITGIKRERILKAARHYLMGFDTAPSCRFDAVLYDGKGHAEWIRNAFVEQDGRSSRFR